MTKSNSAARAKIMTFPAALLLLLASGCAEGEPPEPEMAAPVQTAAVERAPIRRIVTARGILHPVDQATVTAKISAPVREFYVNRGDHVRKGQLLAELENRDLAAAVTESKALNDQAEASYRSTTAGSLPEELARARSEVESSLQALEAAKKVYESRKELLEQGALAQRQLDEANVAYAQARSQYDVAVKHLESLEQIGREARTKEAKAQLDAARGRYQAAEVQLAYSRITSPISGVITERPLYAGEMAGVGTPLLTVMDVSRVVARADVPEGQLGFLKAGDPAIIRSPDASAELSGKVTVVSPSLDTNSTTAEVWIEAPNPGERFKPGISVQVAIVAETVPDALVIPEASVLPSPVGSGSIVLVAGADLLAHERAVEIGIREGDRVQVLRGLEPGERVIVVGGLGLEDGARLRIENADKNGEKTNQHD